MSNPERDASSPRNDSGRAVTTDTTGAEAVVAQEPGRFTITVDGQPVGLADYSDRDGRRMFPHTEVDPAFRGRGLANILVAEALQATRATGLRVVPACSMVKDFIDRHPEWADLVEPD